MALLHEYTHFPHVNQKVWFQEDGATLNKGKGKVKVYPKTGSEGPIEGGGDVEVWRKGIALLL
jgi:hypothetical protein